jgi:hypothetical protein
LTSALRPQIGDGWSAVVASTLASSVSENLTNPPPKKEVIRVTLDEDPRSRDQWIQAILLVKSFKLFPKPLDEGPNQKVPNWEWPKRIQIGEKINWFRVQTKKECSKESCWFGEPRFRLGTKVQSNSRIQFASNQSKLVPRKLDSGPSSKVGLSIGCSSEQQQQIV